uniref:Uncharacterized protein n=1 Tax=Globisporangium ultimum (strain ATCC 200006 / CBS 805.95 / DAOM BR144) TaxID=431595 RepID=K3X2H8_GLOUD
MSGFRRGGSAAGLDNQSHYDGSIGGAAKYADDPAFYGSVLDELHAEQKSTIEALSCQVEFYRQREERYKKEVDTLRRYFSKDGGDADSNESFAKMVAENRLLGEEIDALRNKQTRWEQEKQRMDRARLDLETQLKDAKHSLASFSQAIEQLELKMQRKEAEVQTRCLELEQELIAKSQECDRLQDEHSAAQQIIQNFQIVSSENQRLRGELQALTQSNLAQKGETESASLKVQSYEESRRQQEQTITELKQQLADSSLRIASAQLEVEKKQSQVKELQIQLENASMLLSEREKMLASDTHARREDESQRHELLALVSMLQREKDALTANLSMHQKEQEALRSELRTVKSRLSTKDHGVMVATLRSEISYLKERLRNEFKHEKDELKTEKASLSHEISVLTGRVAEKERVIHRLQDEILAKDEKNRQIAYDMTQLQGKISSLEHELDATREKYQQLQDCRTALAEKLDYGFKELLNDEESAASAYEELEKLHKELAQLKKKNSTLEMQRQSAVDELDRERFESTSSSSRLNAKIDDLYRQLYEKDEMITSLKRAEQQLVLHEKEKASWEQQLDETRSRMQQGVEAESHKVQDLRSQVAALEDDRAALKDTLADLQREIRDHDEQRQAVQVAVQESQLEVEAGKQEQDRLQQEISRLEAQLSDAVKAVENGRQEKSSREKKLLRERKQMEAEMIKLFDRIEVAGKRNLELGEKVIAMGNQAKVDQTDLIALSTQVKTYKQTIRHLEGQLSKVSRSTSRETESVHDLKRRLSQAVTTQERYQVEIATLRKAMEHLQSEKDVVQKQRDEAMKRVRLLMQCQEQMKSTVEGHTTELVEEIEATQNQLEAERKRCTVLLANEKSLLRDLQDRNAAITKLQRSIQMLQPRKPSYNGNESFSRSNGTATTAATTNSPLGGGSSPVATSREPRRQQHQPASAPAKELDHLLSNLERISEFSAQQQMQDERY